MPVPRGPSLAGCSAAIAAAAIADATARQERDEAVLQRREEAFRAVMRRPLSVALVDAAVGSRARRIRGTQLPESER